MPTFSEINDFVVKHTGADYFDADVKLYKKHFPNSKLIAELDRAPGFAKKGLDERIVYELLSDGISCIDCIWENRGFTRDSKNAVLPIENTAGQEKKAKQINENTSDPVSELLKTDLKLAKYNTLKKLVFDLNLDESCENHKADTYRTVLSKFSEKFKAESKQDQEPIDDKKKEGQE